MKGSGSRRYDTPASRAIRRAILAKKRKDLSAKQDKDTGWKEEYEANWKEEYEAKVSPSAQDITKRHTIILVDQMEQAYQYFEMKDFLRAQEVFQYCHGVPEEFIDDIIDLIKAEARFEKLDTENIRHALTALDWELQFTHHALCDNAPDDITNERITYFNGEMMTTASESEPVQVMSVEEICEKAQQLDYYISTKMIFGLVYETLKTNRVLHQKPEEELEMLKKTRRYFYYDTFISEERKYKEKTVTFAYDGCDASQEDIKTSLSVVGEILSVHSSRLGEQLHMAHVTFRDLTTANDAICLAAQGQLKVNGRPVSAVLTSYNKPTSDLPAPTLQQYTAAAMSALEKVEDELLADARNRYTVLVEKANGRKMDNKRKRDAVLPDDLESGMDNKRRRDAVLPDDDLESVLPDNMQSG